MAKNELLQQSPQSLSLKMIVAESPMNHQPGSSLKMEMLQKKSSKLSIQRKASQNRFKNTDLIEEANLIELRQRPMATTRSPKKDASPPLQKEQSVNRMSAHHKNDSFDESAGDQPERNQNGDQTKYAIQISKESSINQLSEEERHAR